MNNINAVEMKNISMIFNKKIVANKNINLEVKKGEVHALMGENGAGKSTLMSILFGIYEPTEGNIFVNGKEEIISSPVKATKLGIGMVHQHFKLVDIFPVWKNIILGSEETKYKQIINKKKIIEDLTKIMTEYNLEVDLNAKVKDISVGMKQRVEILKTLYRKAEIMVFDEPTAVLTPIEIEGLLKVIKELKAMGKTIILITHKMAEIKEVADRATIIRKGTYVGTYDVKKTSASKLAEAMVGRKIVEIKNNHKPNNNENLIVIEDLNVKKHSNNKVLGLKNFSTSIKAGEILGIAGVEGNGQIELAEAISGMVKVESGKVYVKDKNITNESISKRYNEHKMGFIPEDRHKFGLVLDANLITNVALQDISTKKYSKRGFINKTAMQTKTQQIISKFDVRNADAGFAIARQLSGGNQQKMIIGRELSRENNFIIIFQPTRGLDVGSIEFIHAEILRAKEEGKAILLISYELSEILQLSDRILVLNSGQIVGEVSGKEATREIVGKMMVSSVME
ncbi:ribose/galactose ABC transporter ATP-binding protein [Mesoplasma entomophilum]|uniref:Sugar ABC transporter ATP-binding protein n=1 Tax=Mesoplasma entomophilum TaxID=2149 RepID=A0A3S5Y0F5_9MOLU|nr:ABC transporter ATP-binding protein [Mesoplasma entomophilum]ATQ35837.1 sugar ABC transporter ATP-binding protein [Mesoplasma entomophilum]ATZ19809.1 ribose/galactose ABC transporter ATP-binding protein [Mesoplasma entomophilum]